MAVNPSSKKFGALVVLLLLSFTLLGSQARPTGSSELSVQIKHSGPSVGAGHDTGGRYYNPNPSPLSLRIIKDSRPSNGGIAQQNLGQQSSYPNPVSIGMIRESGPSDGGTEN